MLHWYGGDLQGGIVLLVGLMSDFERVMTSQVKSSQVRV